MKALTSFTLLESDNPFPPTSELRPAKVHSSHPDSRLLARLATMGDKKARGARERSRYYLFHPDKDPLEAKLRDRKDRRERSGRGGADNRDYRRRNYDDREHRRRRDDDLQAGFDDSLYDDSPAALATRARRRFSHSSFSSASSSTSTARQRVRLAGKELFPDRRARNNSRLDARHRARSASPDRNDETTPASTNGAHDMDMDTSGTVPRVRAPPSRELFPGKLVLNNNSEFSEHVLASPPPYSNGNTSNGRELFPLKATRSHRRSDAFDAADETADLFAGKMAVPFVDGAGDRRRMRSLAERVTLASEVGRLKGDMSVPSGGEPDWGDGDHAGGLRVRGAGAARGQGSGGFAIKGTAGEGGFAIKGAAAATSAEREAKMRELFPGKRGNAGKELFDDRLEGRGAKRRVAEDMSY
jgi:hypothetical protein